MDIFKFAMKMEKDGEAYYRELAHKNGNNVGISSILFMLAEEEVKHYDLLKEFKDGSPKKIESHALQHIKNIFAKMRDRIEKHNAIESEVELYREAQELEKKSENFYLKCANETKDAQQKGIFGWLADEEKKHYNMLEALIEYVNRPEEWLENSEWHHLDEY